MKFSRFDKGFVKVSLSVALLISQSSMAEYDYDSYAKGFGSDLNKAESALGSVTAKKGTTGASLSDQLQETFLKNEKIITSNKEELELRTKLRNWVKKNDDLKKLKGLPDVVLQKALKGRQLELDKAEALSSQLNQNQNFSNPSDFSTGNLPKACQKNVDFTQLRGMLDQLNTEPGQYLQRTAKGLIEEKGKELNEKLQTKIADVMKYFKELSSKDDSVEALKSDELKGDIGIEKRIAELKAKNKEQKEINKEEKAGLVDVFSKFIGQLGTIKENDKRVAQLGGEFVKMLQGIRRNAMAAAQEQTDQLLSNCDSEIRGLQNDITMSTQWMVRAGIREDVAQADTQAQLARAQGMQCQDVSDRVQAILQGFGTTGLNQRINNINNAKNPTVLMSEAVLAMQDVSKMQAELGQELKPLMNDCEDAANAREAVKQRMQPIMSQQQAQAGQTASSARTGTRGNWGPQSGSLATGNPATHNGANRSSSRR